MAPTPTTQKAKGEIPKLAFLLRLSVLSIDWDHGHSFICKLLLDDKLLDRFEGCGGTEWIGSGKKKNIYGVLPGDESFITAKFYHPCAGNQDSKPFASGEIRTWTLMSEDTTFIFPVVLSSNGLSTVGRMKIRMYPKTSRDHSIDIERMHKEPTLANLCQALRAIRPLEVVNIGLCNIARFHLECLYTYMREYFDALSSSAKAYNARDQNRRLVDPMDICGNPLEDLLIQVRSQLQFASYVMHEKLADAAAETQRHVIVFQILDAAARATLLICTSAYMYFECNYPTLSILPGQNIGRFYAWHAKLIFCRTRLVLLLNGITDMPPVNIDPLLDLLLDMALCEVREVDDWETRSYTMILASTRQKHAQTVFDKIKERLQNTSSKDTRGRDALRRLLTHICQEADLIPRFMLLTSKDVDYAPGVGPNCDPKPGSTGEGSYSIVYEGRLTDPKSEWLRPVAIKRLKFVESSGEDEYHRQIKQIYMEVVQTWTLKHPRVISLLGVTHTFGGISLIVPWMKNKTIHRCLNAKKKEKGAKTPLVEMCNEWIVNVAEGLAYLHAEGIVHGDLRGDNVLVDGNYKAVIADFGLTTFAHGHSRNYASIRKGDSGWSAPELLNSKDGYSSRQTSASDVYAFAIVCIEIYLGRAPFNKEDGSMAFCRRVMDGLRPDRPEVPVRLEEQSHGELMRDDLWEVVSECWDGDKSKRPTARNVLRRLVSSRS